MKILKESEMNTKKDKKNGQKTPGGQENLFQYMKEQEQMLREQAIKIRKKEEELIEEELSVLQLVKDKLLGLAFSGGGIRSATFNLGVLQAMAEKGLLTKCDYLSTVSGGGYIGSWLSAWIWRECDAREKALNSLITFFAKELNATSLFNDLATEPIDNVRDSYTDWKKEYLEKNPEKRDLWKNMKGDEAVETLLKTAPMTFQQERDARHKARNSLIIFITEAMNAPSWFNKLATGSIDNVRRSYTDWKKEYLEKNPEKRDLWKNMKGDEAVETLLEAAPAKIQRELAASADSRVRTGRTVADAVAADTDSSKEPKQITFLRKFSNYLTPKLGLLSYDTLAAVATYIRNFLLNQIILALALAFLLLLPRTVALLADIHNVDGYCQFAGSCLALAFIFINLNLIEQQRKRPGKTRWFVKPSYVFVLIVLPLVLAAMTTGFIATVPTDKFIIRNWYLLISGGLFVFGIIAILWIREWLREREMGHPGSLSLLIWNPLGLVGGIATALGLLILLYKQFSSSSASAMLDCWGVTVWGMPAALGIFALAVTVQIGITGRPLNEDCREWWGRLGGAYIGVAVAWITVSACALYAPYWLISLQNWVAALGVAWIISTAAGVLTAASAYTGKPGSKKLNEIVPQVAPYVFIAGLLMALSYALYLGLATAVTKIEILQNAARASKLDIAVLEEAAHASTWWRYSAVLSSSSFPLVLIAGLCISFLAALFLSWRVDVNVFSLHRFYLNRLERCYLGASNPLRRDHPFTGFDPNDGVRLDALVQRPYPIINTAINLTHSKQLAWQERKAASFMFTPIYCGYELRGGNEPVFAYQRTDSFAKEAKLKKDWIGLAKAFAVSGAAVSPNMGYHSTPAVAFLLTMFNVRLGLWIENPAKEDVWKKSCCLIGLWYLLRELFGAADEEKNFVYLSDGGHFENLGIYELVRRRCRFIVASDASMDKSYSFEDLGNAVRKCYIDLGVPIEIDTRAIVPDSETRRSKYHCTVGIIHYERAFPGELPGYLLYIKPSLTGNEPVDVKQYAVTHPEFPHEPTADQWFAESQFESYRSLGCKVARTVLAAAENVSQNDMESFFDTMKKQWYPPSSSTEAAFSKHGDQLKLLQETLRKDKNLIFLDAQIFPEWPKLMKDARPSHKIDLWLPANHEERRAGFYFCTNLLQLMENVYLDLNLQDYYDHPDNRGWMNLFRHWSWSGMFRVTYAITFSTYGARFQQFCLNRLDLAEGEIKFEAKSDLLQFLSTAEKNLELNFLEIELIRKLHAGMKHFDIIIPLRLCVINPTESVEKKECEIQYEFGFALARGEKNELVYFRIQDHLRNSGLARKALMVLHAAGYAWPAFKDGKKSPYEEFLASLGPVALEEFKQRYGDNPDAFQRLCR